jgi:hypothetical protein
MAKLSLLVMLGLTVLFSLGLRWREKRRLELRPPARGAPPAPWIARQRHALNRWATAAALAALATMLVFGGLNWLRVWTGG